MLTHLNEIRLLNTRIGNSLKSFRHLFYMVVYHFSWDVLRACYLLNWMLHNDNSSLGKLSLVCSTISYLINSWHDFSSMLLSPYPENIYEKNRGESPSNRTEMGLEPGRRCHNHCFQKCKGEGCWLVFAENRIWCCKPPRNIAEKGSEPRIHSPICSRKRCFRKSLCCCWK